MNDTKQQPVDEASVVLYTKEPRGHVFPKPPTIEELRRIRLAKQTEAKTNPVPRARISWKPKAPVNTPIVPSEGWWHPSNSRKWHYFVGSRSLCGKWGTFALPTAFVHGNDSSPDNCKACQRDVLKRKEQRHDAN